MAYSDDRLEEIFERSRELNPDFLDNTASLAFEMHSDWLSVLAAENIKRINDADACDYVFHTASSTEFIFNACSKLSLPNEVKYSAVFIFDSFMVQLVTYFYQKVMRSKHSLRRKFRQWEHVEATLSRQIALRVLSAIQIASKMHSYHESLSIETVKLCLKKYGYCYPDDSIMKSELRMLSMIDWNPTYHCTPLVYVESLFKIINKFLNLINFQLFPETNKVVTLILCGLLEGKILYVV
ncbi:unnamed protein product [Thelazia callipaeda]|uniref:CYCLIN domain-containing protein n=1 Tax=Thelazia callipaeda TaxID=103827 RepID=A0A0N5CSK6_THECL|nr:unnamed protein product [Thelazia callipaeda]